MEAKEKKKFNETGFGKFLSKAGDSIPGIASVAIKAATGNVGGAIEDVKNLLLKPENRENPETQSLLHELEIKRMEFQKELLQHEKEIFELEVADKNSARNREVEMAKAGKSDFMMKITGLTLIASWLACVAVIIVWEVPESNRQLFSHLMGIIEGAFVTSMVGYYFGTSKSSSEKTKMMLK